MQKRPREGGKKKERERRSKPTNSGGERGQAWAARRSERRMGFVCRTMRTRANRSLRATSGSRFRSRCQTPCCRRQRHAARSCAQFRLQSREECVLGSTHHCAGCCGAHADAAAAADETCVGRGAGATRATRDSSCWMCHCPPDAHFGEAVTCCCHRQQHSR